MKQKGRKKLIKKVENTEDIELTKGEKQVLDLLVNDFLTIGQIAKIRHTKDKAVYKIISKLKKKGLIKKVENNFYKGGVTAPEKVESDNKLRLHAQSLQIKIISSSPNYERALKLCNQDMIDGNTLQLYKDNITIYFNKSFFGFSVDECIKRSLLYIEKFLIMVENNFKIILVKSKYQNIKFFRSEIAKTTDPLAKRVIELKESAFKVYDDLGKLRLIVDNSFKLEELEAVSSEFAGDMRKVQNFYKDILQKETLLPSEISKHLTGLQIADNLTSSRISKNEELLSNLMLMIEKQQNLINSMNQEIESLKTPSWSKF